jgi:hypothetical protein
MDDGRWSMDQGRFQYWRALLWAGIAIASWLGMQVVHEVGHVAGAWFTGGRVTHVELKPWTISRTDVEPNPRPLVERWSGPIAGSMLPVLAWLTAARARRSWAYLLRFFAGFCLIANGAYLGVGAFWPVGDAADILRIEPARWPLVVFGLVAAIAGFALWHRLGAAFGIGPGAQPVRQIHVIGIWFAVAAIIVAESVM